MKETRMPPALAVNRVANSGNTIYGVGVIEDMNIFEYGHLAVNKLMWNLSVAIHIAAS